MSVNNAQEAVTTTTLAALPVTNTSLPPVDWKKIGAPDALIPTWIPLETQNPTDPMPKADIAVVTWTVAEWMALHHVLCAPQQTFTVLPDYSIPSTSDWRSNWIPYQYEFDQIVPYLQEVVRENKGHCPSLANMAWARICMIGIGDLRVLLVKSDMHLAQDGPEVPVKRFIEKIIKEAEPRLVLSTGTAGAVRRGDTLGSVMVSCQGYLDLTTKNGKLVKEYVPEFAALNNTTAISSWTPPATYLDAVEQNFIQTCEPDVLAPSPAYESGRIKAIETTPKIHVLPDSPIITTDTFLFGTTDYELEPYGCIVEMGDAVVGMVCSEAGVPFGFARNASDPVINIDMTTSLKSTWAAYIYKEFGLETSYNSALTIWGLLAGTAEKTTVTRGSVEWFQVAPAPLRNSLSVQPVQVTGDDTLRDAASYTTWDKSLFVSRADGITRLTFDPAQSGFGSKRVFDTTTLYSSLTTLAFQDGTVPRPYLIACRQDENTLDCFRIEADAVHLELSFPCEPGEGNFSVIHAYEGYKCQLLMAYSTTSGDSRIYEVKRDDGALSLQLLWQKGWAPGWEHFSFFTMGKENFFFKTNVNPTMKRKMANIDHYMDTPADGAHPVCTVFPEEAVAASAAASISLTDGPGLVLAGTDGFSIQRINSDCQGWQCQVRKSCEGPFKAIYILPLTDGQSLLGLGRSEA